MKTKVSFNFKHGKVEGLYFKANPDAPLVVITNGHNGFYNYGMFPYIQEQFLKNGVSSYSYNFSHGGIVGDSDYFTRLDLYEKNCMRLETEDLCGVVRNLTELPLSVRGPRALGATEYDRLILFSHSMGSIPVIFGAKKLIEEGSKIDGIILISPVCTLELWGGRVTDEWEKNGVHYIKNSRTKQDLPQGREFLEEIKQANGKWNVRNALEEVSTNFLIIHGEEDESVPIEHAKNLYEWNKKFGHKVELKIIPNASHTYNTKHPFEGASEELEKMIKVITQWINNI